MKHPHRIDLMSLVMVTLLFILGLFSILNVREKGDVSGVSNKEPYVKTETAAFSTGPKTVTQKEYVLDYLSKILSLLGGNASNSITPTPTPILAGSTVPTNIPTQTTDVTSLVNSIRANCIEDGESGRVTIRNASPPTSCLNKIQPPLKSNVLDRLTDFVDAKWDHLQCVQFARAASALTNNSNGFDFCQPVNGAIDCAKNNGAYTFRRNTDRIPIKAGDFAIWDCQNTYGHMAYVVNVYSESFIRVAEANWDSQGTVQERNENLNYNPRQPSDPKCKIIGWLTK